MTRLCNIVTIARKHLTLLPLSNGSDELQRSAASPGKWVGDS